MKTRKSALFALIKIIENNNPYNETVRKFSAQVEYPSELNVLVSGVLKHKLTLDFFIEKICDKNIKKLSDKVKNILRLGIFELEYQKNPDYAVINSYVELAKKYEKRASGFVNAILRNFIRKREEIEFPSIKENPIKAISIAYSHPEWLVTRWIKNYGIEDTVKICNYNNSTSKLTLRTNTLKISSKDLERLFIENSIEYQKTVLEDCFYIKHFGKVEELPGFKEGFWLVQGLSSCFVGLALDPEKNDKILDLCAAPGGKTTQIAALCGDKCNIIAVDISEKRIIRIQENCERLGVKSVDIRIADATECKSAEKFDKILIDAPCSNTGVLIKRPDARWNKSFEDIKNLAKIQLDILNNSSKLLKNGGIIVYSTCSIEPEENTQLIAQYLEQNSDFKLEKMTNLDKLGFENEGTLQILPSKHKLDGFFIAKLRKI